MPTTSRTHTERTQSDQTPTEQFEKNGYFVVRGALPESVLQPIRDLIDRNVDAHARELLAAGDIDSTHADASFERRLALLYRDTESRMRSWNTFLFSPELYDLVRHRAILDSLQPVLGEEISFNGDYHLRPKLPGRTNTAFPLHQDSQYYGPTTGPVLVISVWIPLVDVDEHNGCLHLIPGSHKWGLLPGARRADQNMVSFEDVTQRGTPVPEPMRCGDFLAFHNLTFHGSSVNHSDGVRWSVDVWFRETPGYREQSEPERIGDRALQDALDRSARPPLVVRSRHRDTLGDYSSWVGARQRLQEDAARRRSG